MGLFAVDQLIEGPPAAQHAIKDIGGDAPGGKAWNFRLKGDTRTVHRSSDTDTGGNAYAVNSFRIVTIQCFHSIARRKARGKTAISAPRAARPSGATPRSRRVG